MDGSPWGVGYWRGRGDVQVQDGRLLLLGGAVGGAAGRLGSDQGRVVLERHGTRIRLRMPGLIRDGGLSVMSFMLLVDGFYPSKT